MGNERWRSAIVLSGVWACPAIACRNQSLFHARAAGLATSAEVQAIVRILFAHVKGCFLLSLDKRGEFADIQSSVRPCRGRFMHIALERLVERQRARGGDVVLTSVQPAVRRMLRTGLIELIGEDNIYWSAVEAIVAAHNAHAATDCVYCRGLPLHQEQPAPARVASPV
jgi:hypothetical protein